MIKNEITAEEINSYPIINNPNFYNKYIVERKGMWDLEKFNILDINEYYAYKYYSDENPGYWGIRNPETGYLVCQPKLLFEPHAISCNRIIICEGSGWENYNGVYKCEYSKWGIIDFSGKQITPVIYDYLKGHNVHLKNSESKTIYLCLIGSQWGTLDNDGNEIIPIEYDTLNISRSWVYTNFIARKKDKWGVLNYNGITIIPFDFDYIYEVAESESNDNYYACKKDNGIELRNTKNEIIIESGKYDKFGKDIQNKQIIAYKKIRKRGTANATILDINTKKEITELKRYIDFICIDYDYYFAYDKKYKGIMVDKEGNEILNNICGKTISMIDNVRFKNCKFDYWAFVFDEECYDVWFNITDDGLEYEIKKYDYDEEKREMEQAIRDEGFLNYSID